MISATTTATRIMFGCIRVRFISTTPYAFTSASGYAHLKYASIKLLNAGQNCSFNLKSEAVPPSAHSAMSVGQTNVPSMSPANDPEIAAVLTCWKDIAQYVGKGVRTVQRGEKEMGFPVRRTTPGEKAPYSPLPERLTHGYKRSSFPRGS